MSHVATLSEAAGGLPAMPGAASAARAASARHLTQSIQLEEGTPSRLARAAIWLGLGAVVLFVFWASVLPLKELAIGRGQILPLGFVQPVQHLEGGIVADIRVREGDSVRAGDTLIVMDDAQAAAELNQAHARKGALALTAARLMRFTETVMGGGTDHAVETSVGGNGGDSIGAFTLRAGFDGGAGHATQNAMLMSQMRTRDAQLAIAAQEIESRERLLESLRAQEANLAAEIGILGKELESKHDLVEKGLLRRSEYHALERVRLQRESELLRLRGEIAAGGIAVAQGGMKRIELVEELQKQAFNELGRVEAELAETDEVIARLEDRVRRLAVVAPVGGVVKDMAVRNTGAVLSPGAVIAEIVPEDGAVFAEIEMPAENMGHVRTGLPAQVKATAYDFTRYGAADAVVDQVSASSFRRDDGTYYFRVRLRLDGETLTGPDGLMRLTPGMTVSADIRTGEKTLLAYLLRPLRTAVDSAFAEK